MNKFLKKWLCIVMALAVTVASLPLFGIDLSDLFIKSDAASTTNYIESGDYVYVKRSNTTNEIVINKYIGDDINIVVPEKIDGYTVTGIESEAFTDSAEKSTVNLRWKNPNLKNIESVVLPDTVTYIDTSAFENCTKLAHIDLPENLWYIYQRAFYGTALTEITLPEKTNTIYGYAFEGTNIKELVLPESVKYLNEGSLFCETLEKVLVEGYLKGISQLAFSKKVTLAGTTKYVDRYPEEILFRHSQPSYIIDYGFSDMVKNEETGYWEAIVYEKAYFGYSDDDIKSNGTVDYIITPENKVILLSYNLTSTGTYGVSTIYNNGQYLPVIEIAPYAFSGCNLKKVTIASTVKRIGYAAFKDCENLRSVTLPEGLKTIESATFYGCTYLSFLDTGMPESVTEVGSYAFFKCGSTVGSENIEKMGQYAYYNSSIYEYNFDSLKEVPPYAFYCSTFGKIDFPEGVERIGEYAFYYSYLDSVTFPETLKRIDGYAFSNCSLSHLELPQSLEYLGVHAFANTKLTAVDIPPLLTVLSSGVFVNCPIEKIYIPSNIKVISTAAFNNRNFSATEIIISEGVEEIGSSAFSGKVEELTIPSTVKKLYTGTLCQMLIDELNYNAIDAEIVDPDEYTTDSLISSIQGALPTLRFGEGIKTIPDAFARNSDVESIVFPDSIEHIGKEAFNNCTKLQAAALPVNLKEIGDYAFRWCSFSRITLPDSIEKIGDYAFAGCKGITEITLPKNTEWVGQYAFADCDGITEITIPENVQSIGELTFYNCTNIETVNLHAVACDIVLSKEIDADVLPESPFISSEKLENINLYNTVKELPAFFYAGLQNIDEISLPESVTDIGVGAFANSSVSGFDSLANIESIEEYAFKNCSYLEEIKLENNLMIIGMEAFSGCDWLKSIYIPDSVSNIETSAFEGCTKLESVRMSSNVDFIPRQAFNNCKSLSEFIWKSNRKLIGRYAFGNCVKLSDFDFANVEKLYKNSFTGSGVSVVHLGESQNEQNAALETVEVQSFKDCEKLETVGIGGNVSTVKSQAFADCVNLETAVIAESVTNIADDAFDGCDNLTIYCAEDSYAYSYAQTQGIKVSTFVIAAIPNQTYTGFEITPEVSVSLSGDTLDKNVDFGVTYANNINVGNADVTVKGKGDFRMFASRANFAIVTKNIADASVAPIVEQAYTGSAVTPAVTITCGGKILHEGTDYTVTYSNNVEEGTAKVKIVGKGNYSGSSSAEFQIKKMSDPQSFISRIFSVFNSFFAKMKAFFVGLFI